MLEKLDLTKKLGKEEYREKMGILEAELGGFSANARNWKFQ